jgi:hypothetical protein
MLDIRPRTLLIGAFLMIALGTGRNARADDLGHLQTYLNPDPIQQDGYETFGSSVTAIDDYVLVGNRLEANVIDASGAAYLFDARCGNLIRTFANPTPAEWDWFAASITTVAGGALIGAPGYDTAGADAGAAYLFKLDDGMLIRTFLNPTPTNGGRFELLWRTSMVSDLHF